MKRKFIFIVIPTIVAILLTSCGVGQTYPATPPPLGAYYIDPVFGPFYGEIGGEDIFGPAITTIFTHQNKKMQFLETGLLVFDPDAEGYPYSFAPLGEELNLYEPPDLTLVDSNRLIINGYVVDTYFVDFYRQLGAEFVGMPVTNPQVNYTKNRVEQHFQNLGFYYLLDDPNHEVHLLAYGLAACKNSCRFRPSYDNMITGRPELTEPFGSTIYQLGFKATGGFVGGPVEGPEGHKEVIFEYLVFIEEEGIAKPKPIVEMLGYTPEPLTGPLGIASVVFFPIEGDLGHNVAVFFDEFIRGIGGYSVSGQPITELFIHNQELNIARQCFANMCLDYYSNEEGVKVRPVALGVDYKNLYHPGLQAGARENSGDEESSTTRRGSTKSIFQLNIWETSPLITSTETQTISASVFVNGVPQAGQKLVLMISIPGAEPQLFDFPLTDENGNTSITLAPIEAANSTLVTFQVCVVYDGDQSECASNNFMIWGNP